MATGLLTVALTMGAGYALADGGAEGDKQEQQQGQEQGGEQEQAPEKSFAERMFERLDNNGDGQIDEEEAAGGRRPLDMAKADADQSGGISLEEFKTYMTNRRVDRMLDRFDANKDGKIQADEIPEGRFAERMKSLDKDGDGVITRDELAKAEWGRRGRRGPRGGDGERRRRRGGEPRPGVDEPIAPGADGAKAKEGCGGGACPGGKAKKQGGAIQF
jgi:hypothetical protein